MNHFLIAALCAAGVMCICSEQFNALLARTCERLADHFWAWRAALVQFRRTYREVKESERERRMYV